MEASDDELEALRRRVEMLEERVRALEASGPATVRPALASAPMPRARGEASSLESRVGSQWFNRVGIVALLVGVAWFLKFAVDQRWLGPTARVLVGMALGAALIAWSERFVRRGFIAFSYSLKAAGTGVLYLSVWAGFSLYGLFPSLAALVLMVSVTATNAWFAWRRRSELVAALSLLGGLLTPLLLDVGRDGLNLFTYVLVLDVAMVVAAALWGWRRLLLGALAGTGGVLAYWSAIFYGPQAFTMVYVFLIAFGLLFVLAPVWMARRHDGVDDDLLVLEVLLTAFMGYAAFYILIGADARFMHAGSGWPARGRMAGIFAAAYLVLGRSGFKAGLLRSWHEGLGVAFAVLSVPLYWSGTMVTLLWAVEGVVLLGTGFRLRMALLRWEGLLVLGLGVAKVFLVDTRELSPVYRMLTFIGFGVLLLAISFVYQKDLLKLRE